MEEPRGTEPEALLRQARDAVEVMAGAGWTAPGRTVTEFGSPHGGSWLGLLTGRGMSVSDDGPADLVVDNIGMMHEPDQAAALAARATRVAPGGVLTFQYHSLGSIVAEGQWNALRHGHYGYYSTPTLVGMLASVGFTAVRAHWFPLYGGTVLLAATRDGEPDASVGEVIAWEGGAGVQDLGVLRGLQRAAEQQCDALFRFLVDERAAGRFVLGYSAASRSVALLSRAGIGPDLLPSIADSAPTKHGRRLPGSGIPVIAPAELVSARPHSVVLFVADLLPEVRAALPEIEANGGRWIVAGDRAPGDRVPGEEVPADRVR